MSGKRLMLVHWDADEVDDLAIPLRTEGCSVETEASDSSRTLKSAASNPPDAILVFLARDAARGRELARTLFANLHTSSIPVVFVGGSEHAVQETRSRFPDALFVDADHMCDVLKGLLSID